MKGITAMVQINRTRLRCVAILAVALSAAVIATKSASAQAILQYGFDFTSGDVQSQGGTVNDDSGVFNTGQILVGNGGTYTADIPGNTQFTAGIGSLDVSNNNSIGTDPTGSTNQGTGLLVPSFNFLNFTEITNAGGLTVEVWAKNLRPGSDETLGQVVSVGAVYGIMVDSSSRIRAFNGFSIGQAGSAMTSVLTNDWTHLAAVYSNPVVNNNALTVDIELFVNGTSADVVQGSVILQDLNRGAGIGNNAVATINPEAADGIVFEPRISLGALSPSNFTIATPVALPVYPSLQIDRETGAMTLVGGDSDFEFLGYSIRSATAQGLDPSSGQWTTITGNYDVNGTGLVDNADAWEVLSDPQAHNELSEQEVTGGSGGGVIDTGANIDLGTPWIQTPLEDVVMDLILPNGQAFRLSVNYVGNDGQAFAVGDLNFDGAVDAADWPIYRAGIREDLAGLSPAEGYHLGDLNGDGVNNARDLVIFRTAYLDANPGASFSDLTSNVPEPSSAVLLVCCIGLIGLRKSSRRWFDVLFKVSFTTRLIPLCSVVTSRRRASMKKAFLSIFCGLMPILTCSGIARADVVSVDFQTNVDGFFINMSGVESNAAAADADFNAANVWNIAGLTSHYSVEGSVDSNPSWGNFVNSTGKKTTARFSITGDVIGTDVVGVNPPPNALNIDALFFSQPGASNTLTWQLSGLAPGTPFKLFLNQLDVATWLGNPQNRAMSGLIDTNGDGTPNQAYQMDFPGVLVTGTVAADGIVRGTSFRTSSTPNIFVTEPNWAGWQLSAEVPDALTLEVNTTTGNIKLVNSNNSQSFDIDYYEILSNDSSLDKDAWGRLAGQSGEFPTGDGSGNGWEDAGTPRASFLGEVYLDGGSTIDAEATINLGNAYDVSVDAQDLIFSYVAGNFVYEGNVVYVSTPIPGDFNSDGNVDGLDFAVWQSHFPTSTDAMLGDGDGDGDGDVDGADFVIWQTNFQSMPAASQVPEPISLISLSLGALLLTAHRCCWRRGKIRST
jgi:hypothetical protein